MAITETRDITIEATPGEIMDVLVDLESLTEWSPTHQKVEVLERDEQGFVMTGTDLPKEHGKPKGWTLERDPFMFETNIPGVFAAGDVRSGANRRVAAAVGEGSAAIYSVHRYLRTV